MKQKRTGLDQVLSPTVRAATAEPVERPAQARVDSGNRKRPGVRQQTAYLPEAVYQQLRRLAFEEEAKMHDYLMLGLDLVFKEKGLKSISELTGTQE
jgi:hypothetical protein